MGAAGGDVPSEDQFNRVSFLSHFEGANNGVNNAFDDGSASNHTITAAGNVTQGSFGPFARPDGEWGVTFDGTGDYLSAEDDTNFSFGTGDFTVECLLFRQSNSATINDIMGTSNNSAYLGSNRGGWVLAYYHNYSVGNLYAVKFGYQYNNSFPVDIAFTKTLNANTWYHLAITRQGNQLKCFVDGTQTGNTVTDSTNMISTEPLTVGTGSGASNYVTGNISNVRVIKGTAVYTSNFTPPTSPLTAITNTKLLTCQSNRFVDNSASALTVTPSGNPAVTSFGPFLTSAVYDAAVNGASGYFRGGGTDDYLITANASSDFNLGTGQFTFECWVYLTSSAQQTIMGSGVSGSSSMFNIFLLSGVLQVHSPSAVIFSNAGTLQLFAWQHIVVERDSNNDLKAFLNGTQTATTNTTADFGANNIFKVGTHFNGTNDLSGYVSDVRFIKGSGVAPQAGGPTAPLSTVTNTKLLLNMADGQAIDSAAQNNLTLYGNAKISTAQAKFGNTSLLLDGTGDAAQIATTTNLFAFGTGDYTVEMWLYLTAVNENDQIFDMRTSDSSVNPGSYLDSSARPNLYISGGVRLTSNTAISANTWTHFAICRASGTTRIFQAGQVTGTLNSDTYNIVAGKLMLGARYNSAGTNNGQGHWEDVRVSNMARYTSNFTAPAEPFADKGQ